VTASDSFPEILCSWTSPDYFLNRPCTVVEAVRATTAVRTFFKPAQVEHTIPMSYFDIKLQCNNPTQFVLDEARALYRDQPISFLLSLGTGQTKILGQPCDDFQQRLPTRLLRTLQDVITDCEQKSLEMECELSRHSSSIFYRRLNHDYGRRPLAEWRCREFDYLMTAWRPEWNLAQLLRVLKGTRAAIHLIQPLTKT